MSVGTPSDSPVAEQGSVGQGSPSVTGFEPQGMPTDGAFAATEDHLGDASLPEDAAEGVVLSEDDLAWLQSDEVRQALAQNSIPGIYTEAQFQEHKAQLQKTLREQENARISELQRQSQEQLAERQTFVEAQSAALVGALYQAWKEAGLEPDSPEWNQRQQQVLEATQTRIDRATAQRTRSTSQRNQQIAEHARQTYELLRAYGVELPQGDPGHMAIRQYLSQVQTGQIPQEQLQNAQANVIRQIISTRSQAQPSPQQQPQPQQPVTPQQSQPTRPNPGPMRSVRGAGGGAGRTFDEIYDAGEQKLIQQYGDATKVPQSAWDSLHVEASMQAAR